MEICVLKNDKGIDFFFYVVLMSTETGVSEVSKVFLGEIFQSLNY